MKQIFNNYTLTNDEIEKILKDFRSDIKQASKINGVIDEDCEKKLWLQYIKN